MKVSRALIAFLGLMAMAAMSASPGSAAVGKAHDREFWRGIVAGEFALPEGESAAALIRELSGLLGSRDTEERDTFGYGIPARWIYVQKLLGPDELRGLIEKWTGNLEKGIGETGTDTVLLRSFSALDLSIIAAHDNRSPFLEKKEFQSLLDEAIGYFRREKDVRGFEPEIGWIHSVAHTADLLKFLGRSRHLDPGGQSRILDAIAAKMDAPDGRVYVFGEDERMARAVLSLIVRQDFRIEGFGAWLDRLETSGKGLWEGTLDTRRFAQVQNTKNLLRSLYVILSQAEPAKEQKERLDKASEAVLEALKKL